jgi:hypothetical protein
MVREGGMENPIDICDDSDEGELNCGESLVEAEKYSIDGMDVLETGSDFDADVLYADSVDIFGPMHNDSIKDGNHDEKPLDLDVSLRLNPTDALRKAKR